MSSTMTLSTRELPKFGQTELTASRTKQISLYFGKLMQDYCGKRENRLFIPSPMRLASHMRVTPFEVCAALQRLREDEGVDYQYLNLDSNITLCKR